MSVSSTAPKVSTTVTAKPTPPAPAPAPAKAPSATTTAAPAKGAESTPAPTGTTTDAVKISSEAGKSAETGQTAKEENVYAGIADKTSTVTVDPYKKGKNDTLEGMLRNQGYSLQDIYNKDKNGKTLIDHVASANNLKNPNIIQDGAKIKIPGRENSESLSSMDLKEGESQTSEVKNNEVGVGTESKMEKKKDGSSELGVKTNNKQNPDAELSTQTKVGKDGRIDTNSTATEKGVETNTVAQNKDGSAVTQEKQTATAEGTNAKFKDIDKKGDNLDVKATSNRVDIANKGSEAGGDVTNSVDISEKSSDGMVENGARWVAEKFGYTSAPQAPVNFSGAGEVNVSKNKDGQATVSATKNGEESELLKTAGDTDDTLLERGGEFVDESFSAAKDQFNSLLSSVSDFFSGEKRVTPKAETSKSAIQK
jgi:hypothetical protein